jgi:hypothetical protein
MNIRTRGVQADGKIGLTAGKASRKSTKTTGAQAVGIFSFAPTTMRSFSKLLADLRALTVVPWALAMRVKESPDLTT